MLQFVWFFVIVLGLRFNPLNAVTDCDEAVECQGLVISNSTQVLGSGYKSLANSYIIDEKSIEMLGSFSGFNAYQLHSKANVVSKGTGSCRNSDNIISNDTIICTSSFDCSNTIIQSTPKTVYCNGDSSCKNSKMYVDDTSTIIANGAFSLSNAKITTNALDINSNNYLNISISGYYGGYDTIINCQNGYNCVVNCQSIYSCINATINCDNDSNCIINYLGTSVDNIKDNYDKLDELIAHEIINNITFGIELKSEVLLNNISNKIILNNGIICNDDNTITFDDGNEIGINLINNISFNTSQGLRNVCFRGWQSGIETSVDIIVDDILTYNETAYLYADLEDVNIICDGGLSCMMSKINIIHYFGYDSDVHTNNVFCSGTFISMIF